MNDLSLHILDILQNSISAGALLIVLGVEEDVKGDLLTITIEDNGKGMTPEQVSKLSDPFFTSRTTRKVGLGVPLLKQSAEQSGGGVEVVSKVGEGTQVIAKFGYSNIDRPPLGDFANAFILTAASNDSIEFILNYSYNGVPYVFDTREVKEVLDGVPIVEPSVIIMLEEMIKENILEITTN